MQAPSQTGNQFSKFLSGPAGVCLYSAESVSAICVSYVNYSNLNVRRFLFTHKPELTRITRTRRNQKALWSRQISGCRRWRWALRTVRSVFVWACVVAPPWGTKGITLMTPFTAIVWSRLAHAHGHTNPHYSGGAADCCQSLSASWRRLCRHDCPTVSPFIWA